MSSQTAPAQYSKLPSIAQNDVSRTLESQARSKSLANSDENSKMREETPIECSMSSSTLSSPVGEPGSANNVLRFRPAAMTSFLWKGDLTRRKEMLELLKEDVFRVRYGETVTMERERTMARIRRLRSAGMFDMNKTPGVPAMRRYDAMMDVIALLDHSLEIKIGVNFGLFGATMQRLGSVAQRTHWMPKIFSGEETGCFALTECGHGSNVRGIETTATFDEAKDAFIIHSPTETSQKFWIGGAAQTCTLSVVFARLIIRGRYHGIHIFLVRLRDRKGNLQRGITVADCGVKAGLNGVDNGRIWFDRVVVPRKDMLSDKCSVSRDGTYRSEYATPDAMFGATLAALVGGRIGIAYDSCALAMLGLTIAVRYGHSRRAFAPAPGLPEVPLMWYTSHQRRLMVPLAAAYVYLPCADALREQWYHSAETGIVERQTHTLSAGFKALFSWFMLDALQSCREACGGQGYSMRNRIAVMRADRDILVTFEGDNCVLMQQVGKTLLAAHARAAAGGGMYREIELRVLNGVSRTTVRDGALDDTCVYNVLCAREKALIAGLGARYQAASKRVRKFDAWNECLYVAQRASTAHMHRRIFEMFRDHCENTEAVDRACGRVLRACGMLWALDEIDRDADFLRLGCIDAQFASRVSAAVPDHCAMIAGVSKELTDAFDFPDHLLAPIAGDYVACFSRAKL